MIFKIALANVIKNKRRTIYTGLAITASVIAMIIMSGFMLGTRDLIINAITGQSGHVLIQNKDREKAPDPYSLEFNIDKLGALTAKLKQYREVKGIYPEIEFGALAFSDTTSLFIAGIGITPEGSGYLKSIVQNALKTGSFLKKGKVAISQIISDSLGLKIGDMLSLYYTRDDFPFVIDKEVGGIFETGNEEIDENLVFIRFDEAQDILQMEDKATSVKVMLDDYRNPDSFIKKIDPFLSSNGLSAKSWLETSAGWLDFINMVKIMLYVINIFITLVAAFCIINTVYMAISERTREIGTMRAIGMKKKGIISMIILESTILGFLGAFAGLIIGGSINFYFSSIGINFGEIMHMFPGASSGVFKTQINIPIMLSTMLFGILISILSCIYPAYKAAYKKPCEALRYI